MPNESYPISCVLKSGGDFNWDHVRRLKSQLDRHLTLDSELFVLSDLMMPEDLVEQNCQLVLLKNNWSGWWSKIELFRVFHKTFYLDLDTVLVGNLNHIVSYPHRFTALRGFYGRAFGSGLMAWNGNYEFIYNDFRFFNPQATMNYHRRRKEGDQEFIGARVKEFKIFQNQFQGQIISYKLDVMGKELPKNAKIVCFHGKPRIQDVRESWLEQELVESKSEQKLLELSFPA